MIYSPKLKNAAEEIKQILQKYDIAGNIVIHTPGFAEYILHITPSYSCAWIENDHIRFRAKKADYNGNELILNQKVVDTTNMLRLLADTSGKKAMDLIRVADYFDKITSANHDDGGHTTHTTQNN